MIGPDGDAHERSCLENRVSLRVCPDGAGALGKPLFATRAAVASDAVESDPLPKVTPYLLRRADSMCTRRLAEEIDGGTRSDDPVNRARLREVFLEAVRNVHAELRAPVVTDFAGIGDALGARGAGGARTGGAVVRPAVRRPSGDAPRPRPRLPHRLTAPRLRIGGWIDLTVVDADRRQGAPSVRPLVRAHVPPNRPSSNRSGSRCCDSRAGSAPIHCASCGPTSCAATSAKPCSTRPTSTRCASWFDERVAVVRDGDREAACRQRPRLRPVQLRGRLPRARRLARTRARAMERLPPVDPPAEPFDARLLAPLPARVEERAARRARRATHRGPPTTATRCTRS